MLIPCILVLSVLISLGICYFAGCFGALSWLWVLPVSFLGSFLVLAGLAFLFVVIMCQRVDTSVPQEHDDPFYRKMVYRYCEAIVWILRMKVHTTGMEKVPTDSRFLLVCNHLSLLDPVIVAAAVKRYEIAFMAKKELSGNGLFKRFLLCIHTIFVSRHNSDMEAMRTSMRALRSGEVLGIFPEGTRYHRGLMEEQEAGAAMIALRSGVPMIPMYISRKLALFRPVDCVVGEPIPMDDLREKGINKETCRELMERITLEYRDLAAEAAAK